MAAWIHNSCVSMLSPGLHGWGCLSV